MIIKNIKIWLWPVILIMAAFFFVSAGGMVISKIVTEPPLPEGWKIIRPPREISTMIVSGNTLWVGGQDGVFQVDLLKKELVKKLETPEPLEYVRALCMDKNGILWIGHQNGLTSYHDNNFRTYTEADGLPDRRVNCLMQDKNNNLWVGTWGGAAVYKGPKWQVLTKSEGLMENMVNIMLQDATGGIWFGHYVAPRGGISYLNSKGRWEFYSVENGLPHNNITAFMEDSSGVLWVGTGLHTKGGCCKFNLEDNRWVINEVLLKEDGLAGEKVRSLFEDKQGHFWLGSEYNGVTVFNVNNNVILSEKDGLSGFEVKVMLQDVDDNIWLGTSDGITVISPQAVENLLLSNYVSDQK